MREDEIRSHRLNYLLKFYMENKDTSKLYAKAKEMNIDNSTATNYCNTVLIQYRRMQK